MYQQITLSSEKLYNVMGLGVDRLIESKQRQIMTTKNYIESLKLYLIAKIDLDRALGGYLQLLSDNGSQPGGEP